MTMMGKPRLEDHDRVLVVEGCSDLLFYAKVLEWMGIADPAAAGSSVFIKNRNGKQDLLTKLTALLTPELLAEKRAIGILVDADVDAGATGRGVAARLRDIAGVSLAPAGGWASKGHCRVGFFVTPSPELAGEIETRAWQAWSNDPANLGARECIETYLACMAGIGLQGHSPDKAKVGALLAVTNDEDPRLGPGARARVFDFARPEFTPLRAFLEGLRLPLRV
jgi:hypothetical protein